MATRAASATMLRQSRLCHRPYRLCLLHKAHILKCFRDLAQECMPLKTKHAQYSIHSTLKELMWFFHKVGPCQLWMEFFHPFKWPKINGFLGVMGSYLELVFRAHLVERENPHDSKSGANSLRKWWQLKMRLFDWEFLCCYAGTFLWRVLLTGNLNGDERRAKRQHDEYLFGFNVLSEDGGAMR